MKKAAISSIALEKFPNVVTEIILRTKVKDAMSKRLITATKDVSLREIQHIMQKERISGVPITEQNKIIGIVSVDDIITALDKGFIEEKTEKFMTKKVVVLEDEMPLNFAISYFEKYHFGRFPVVTQNEQLVGIITSRDILSKLVDELNKEIRELEEKIHEEKTFLPDKIYREFSIKKFDFEAAGIASFEIKKTLKEKNIHSKIIRRASISAYELEINIAIHSAGGKLIFMLENGKITIIARDNGPGIEDVNEAVKEGFSTATDWIRSLGFGAGMGLSNVKRVSDEFEIDSEVGKGTTVQSVIYYS
jgi:CBS domain-containing protein